MTEEMWEMNGFDGMLNETSWPQYDESKCVVNTIEIVAQVNGKIKAKLSVAAGITAEEAISLAKADEKVSAAIGSLNVVKELYVPGKLVNIVVK